jgi:hypothetical protein
MKPDDNNDFVATIDVNHKALLAQRCQLAYVMTSPSHVNTQPCGSCGLCLFG